MLPFTNPPYLFDHEAFFPLPPSSRPHGAASVFHITLPAIPHDGSNGCALADHLFNVPTMAQMPSQFSLTPIPPPPPPQPRDLSAHKNTATVIPSSLRCGFNNHTVGESLRIPGSGAGGRGSRRRSLRKDRHSKIFTAQGPRDRRMRLSLDVARRFFDLQDMLGFDKASKTVEWLLDKSRGAIGELTGRSSSPPAHSNVGPNTKGESSSTSECEVISIGATNNKPTTDEAPPAEFQEEPLSTLPRAKRSPGGRSSKKAIGHTSLSREMRLMARARARERTCEKRMWRRPLLDGREMVHLPPSSRPLQEGGTTAAGTHGMKSSPEMAAEVEQASSYSPEQYIGSAMADGSGPISIFDYTQDGGDGGAISFAHEQWGIQSTGNFGDQRGLLTDVQLQGRPWEPFNSPCI